MTVRYYGPLGDSAASLDELRPLICEADENYWGAGSGSAIVSRGDYGSSPSLIVVVREPHGVALTADVEGHEYVSIDDDSAADGTVEVMIGGDPSEIPARCFVPRHTAWKAIEEFAERNGLPGAVAWAPSHEVMP